MQINEFLQYLNYQKLDEINLILHKIEDPKLKIIYKSFVQTIEGNFYEALETLNQFGWDDQSQDKSDLVNVKAQINRATAYQKLGKLDEANAILDNIQSNFSEFTQIQDQDFQFWAQTYLKLEEQSLFNKEIWVMRLILSIKVLRQLHYLNYTRLFQFPIII